MKNSIFWDAMPCIALKNDRRFGGTYHLHLKGREPETSSKQAARKTSVLDLENRDMFLRNVGCFTRLHGIIS
jgi:hypothetical protein